MFLIALSACSSSTTREHGAGTPPPEFLVFMQPRATAAQAGDVRRFLRSSPRVVRYRFISKDAAYTEFRRIEGKDRPELVATITAADLPESFDVSPATRRDASTLARQVKPLPGVDQVQVAPVASARELRRFCRAFAGTAASRLSSVCRRRPAR